MKQEGKALSFPETIIPAAFVKFRDMSQGEIESAGGFPPLTSTPDIPSETKKRLKEAIEDLPEAFAFKKLREALPDLSDQAFRRSLKNLREQGIVSCTGRGRTPWWVKSSGHQDILGGDLGGNMGGNLRGDPCRNRPVSRQGAKRQDGGGSLPVMHKTSKFCVLCFKKRVVGGKKGGQIGLM